jgi:hypothetical protein
LQKAMSGTLASVGVVAESGCRSGGRDSSLRLRMTGGRTRWSPVGRRSGGRDSSLRLRMTGGRTRWSPVGRRSGGRDSSLRLRMTGGRTRWSPVGSPSWRARFFAAAQNDGRANAGERRAFVRRGRAASVASAPARAFGPVLERDAEPCQPVAHGVCELELPGGAKVVAELHEQVYERLRADPRLTLP